MHPPPPPPPPPLPLLPHQENEKVKEVLKKSRGQPRRRLQHVYDLAKLKNVCEGGDSMEKKFDPSAEPEEAATKTVSLQCSRRP